MSISNLFSPNSYSIYSKNSSTKNNLTIGTLLIEGDNVNNSITCTQLYNAVVGESSGAINSLSGYDNEGTHADVEVGSGLSLSGNVLTAVGSGSGNVIGTPPSVSQTPAIYTSTSGLVIGSSSVTPTTNTLIGYNGSSMSNITAGTNISISAGVISAVGSGTGDVNGPVSSVANTPAQYSNTTGKLLSQPSVTATTNTLIGYNGTSISNITAGTNISISGGVISAAGSAGDGDVTGPSSSVTGALTIFSDTTGKNISEPLFTPANNSLLGYGSSHTVANVLIGDGLALSAGTLSATGSGSGDVTGPISSDTNTPAIYGDTSGKLITNSAVTVQNNTLIGYSGLGVMSNIGAGNGITISSGLISTIAPLSASYGRFYTGNNFINNGGTSNLYIQFTDYALNGPYINTDSTVKFNTTGLYSFTYNVNYILGNTASGSMTFSCRKNGTIIFASPAVILSTGVLSAGDNGYYYTVTNYVNITSTSDYLTLNITNNSGTTFTYDQAYIILNRIA